MSKKYGLILKGSKAGPSFQKPKVSSVFANDDSSEDEETKAVISGGTDWMKKKLSTNSKSGATGLGTKIKAQTKLEMQKALEDDPTVFQYDEVYDKMETAKNEEVAMKKDKDKKPRYITNLLKQAEIREKENERRIERQVQKEREAEGDEFADKEKFVTSAYRKKMEEMAKLEEEEKKTEALENMLDVTKQKDMSGFYRHLFRQTMGEEKGQIKTEVKDEPEPPEEYDDDKKDIEEDDVQIANKTKPSQRSYRRHSETEEEDIQNSSSSSSSEDEQDDIDPKESEQKRMEKAAQRREELRLQKQKRDKRKRQIEEGLDSSEDEENEISDIVKNPKSNEEKIDKKQVIAMQAKKPKIDIWKKITVGDLFETALQRYLQRKSERSILLW